MTISCYGIIPARYASTRFPGKSLVEIAGKPMIWHVYDRSRQCAAFRSVTLATDSEIIGHAADELGMPWVMTRDDHQSGTDRVYEAACKLGVEDDAVVINIQGDEPMVDPAVFARLLEPFADPAVEVSTLATPIQAERAYAHSQVKVVMAANGDALYFSRSLIPHARDVAPETLTYFGHIGLYAFRMRALRRFVALPPSYLERTEKLEQLRLLENNIPIRVVLTNHHSPGVDTPEDLERVRQLWFVAN